MEANPQTQRAFRQGVVLAVVVAAVVGLALQVTKPGEWLENGAFDVRARWTARPEKADPRIVIIDIDNASFDELQEKLGRWPWPRQVWTEIVRYVRKGQPAAIVFDAAFTGEQKEAPAMDEDFARVLQSSGRTVLGFSFLPTQVTGKDQSSRKDVAAFAAQDSRFGYDLAASEWTSNLPLEKLAHAAAGLGSINSTADDRGVTRREPIYFGYDGRAYPSLGAKTVETATPEIKDGWKLRRNWLGARSLVRGDKSVPVDSEGRVLMLWRGHANLADNPEQKVETYKRIPIWEVVCSIYPDQCPNAEHRHPPESFSRKIVLIGASAAGSYEPRPTPMDKQPPGFFAHATFMDNLLNGEAMREASSWLSAMLLLAMAVLGGLIQWKQPS